MTTLWRITMLEKALKSVGAEKCSETYAVSSESPVTEPPCSAYSQCAGVYKVLVAWGRNLFKGPIVASLKQVLL